jgi:hypothetical protein
MMYGDSRLARKSCLMYLLMYLCVVALDKSGSLPESTVTSDVAVVSLRVMYIYTTLMSFMEVCAGHLFSNMFLIPYKSQIFDLSICS